VSLSKVSSLASKGNVHHPFGPKVWVMAPNLWVSCPNEAPSWACSSKTSINKVLQRQKSAPLQVSQVKASWQVKPHLIQEPAKHVHQKLPHQIKQVLKDLMQFVKFRYGRVDKVTYWVNRFSSQGMFPRWNPF
jgi:hypothetical protein